MIIAIPSSGDRIDDMVDERFGRCPYFCFYNTKTDSFSFKENRMRNSPGGVGPQVAEFLAQNGTNNIYAPEVGPKAKAVLDKLKIGVELVKGGHTVSQIIEKKNKKGHAK